MNNFFYIKQIKCPVCRSNINVMKVKGSSLRMVQRDEDFCPHYEPINSLMYNIIVCSECGYAAMDDRFESISDKDIKIVKEKIKPKWSKRDFAGERDMNHAIEAYKLALLNLQIRKGRNSEIARVCLRIAWLYRFLKNEKEKEYLKYALDAYMETFSKESLPVENLDEHTCMYMIGELNRRLGNNQEALKWFYMAISYKEKKTEDKEEIKKDGEEQAEENILTKDIEQRREMEQKKRQARNKMIIDMARNQVQLIKESK